MDEEFIALMGSSCSGLQVQFHPEAIQFVVQLSLLLKGIWRTVCAGVAVEGARRGVSSLWLLGRAALSSGFGLC